MTAFAEQPYVRVLLGIRTEAVTTTASQAFSVLDASEKKKQDIKSGAKLTLKASGNKVSVNGKAVDAAVYLRSTKGRENGTVAMFGKTYRGDIKITAAGGTLTIVNEVPLEEYLYGVVPAEAVPSWPMAALEAQAVAARTYALHNMEKSKGKAYDIQPSTAGQVYNGHASEYARTTQAVDNTRGMVMTHGGKPIDALFHSDGGGYTEHSEHVWGGTLPYLRGVKDAANHEGTSSWTVKTTRKEMESKLKAAGKSVGTLKSIELSPLGKRPMRVSDRGVSGRIRSATFVGTSGKVTVSGEALKAIFGLKSTLFDFYVGVNPPTSPDATAASKAYHTFKKENQNVYIRGYGWGHGLGLSQWGAAAMAAEAKPDDRIFYKKILMHYYTGIKIERLY